MGSPSSATIRRLNRAMKRNLGMHAVWPVGARVRPGDVYVWDEGFFQPHSSLADWCVPFKTRPTPPRHLSFATSSVRVAGAGLRGKASELTDTLGADGELKISFGRQHAFLLRARPMKGARLASPAMVARRVAGQVKEWRHVPWFVVTEVWSASTFVLLGSSARDTSVTFAGDARALANLWKGRVGADLSYTSMRKMGLSVLGGRGAVAMALMRIRRNGAIDYR